MAVNFPLSIDGTAQLPQPAGSQLLTSPDHALGHSNLSLAVIALENKLGQNLGSAANNQILVGVGVGSSTWGSVWTGGSIVNPNATGGTFSNPTENNGTYQNATLGTPLIDFVGARNAGTGVGFNNSIFPSEGTLTDAASGTLTADARAAQIYYSVMGTAAGNRTLATPTNPSPYQNLTYVFKTSGSANGTLVWGTAFRISQDYGTPTLGTGVGWNFYTWRRNNIDAIWDFQGQVKNVV